jgi:phytol kinase
MSIILLWVGFIVLWSFVAWMAKAMSWQAESSRKAIHIGMGVVCAFFPWIFSHPWEVWLLALACVLLLLGMRLVPQYFPPAMSQAINGVSRRSWGDLLFSPSVALAYTLGYQRPCIYCACILLLSIADAAGALVGKRWGANPYTTMTARKSVEGSLAVVAAGATVVFSVLVFANGTSIFHGILIAVIAGCLAGIIEAIADNGFDNLSIPVGMYLILEHLLELPVERLLERLGIIIILAFVLRFVVSRSTLNGGGLLAGVLLLYACHALGGWMFLLPPVAVLILHLRVCLKWNLKDHMSHGVGSIAALAVPVVFWLVLFSSQVVSQELALRAIAWSCVVYLALALSVTRWKMLGRHSSWMPSLYATLLCVMPIWVMLGSQLSIALFCGYVLCVLCVNVTARVLDLKTKFELEWRGLCALLLSFVSFIP